MKILIFRTDIKSRKKVNAVTSIFNKHPEITSWSIDTKDIDNVLRIEATEQIEESQIINLLKPSGFLCETLPD